MKLFERLGMTVALFAMTATTHAKVVTQEVKYAIGNTEHVGFLAYDAAGSDKRPGVLVSPEWIGVNDYSRGRARQLAEMGYVAFVHDPYGGGKNAADPKQAAEWSSVLKADRPELRKRIKTGLETLRKQNRVDGSKIAAIGYCFGGTSVLELARSGADIAGVVSFHGNLSSPMPARAGEIKAKVLVCHGAVDPIVPPEEVAAFEKEMQAASADWQLISYGNAVHSFTNPGAKGTAPGVKYDEKADKRSWEAMKDFLQEAFGAQGAAGSAPAQRGLLGPVEGAGGDKTSRVFTDIKGAQRIVFVCDATGGMINKFPQLKAELTKAITSLDEKTSYNVVFFTNGGKYAIASKQLLPATPANKRETIAFFEQITPNGTTDPLPALEASFRLNPDLVFFLTDGEFNNLSSYAQVSAAFERFNTRKARVNTILYESFDKEAQATLKRIATENGGSFSEFKEQQ